MHARPSHRSGRLSDVLGMMERANGAATAHQISGRVNRVTPAFVSVEGLSNFCSINDIVTIRSASGQSIAQVASIDQSAVNVNLISSDTSIELGDKVTLTGGSLTIAPDISWKGRVLNALGQAIDDAGPIVPGPKNVLIDSRSPPALRRQRLGRHMITGVKIIDLFTPICAGQRIGIFAGSGVGKSTLLAMLSRSSSFDIIVLALVGERSREVRDFLDDTLSLKQSSVIAVVATADETPTLRKLAPSTAMAIAEYFRDRGNQVLLIVDSITRFAHASRELALAAQEPPVARGFPPSVFSALPRLLERAGTGETGDGSITALISVLIDGDDHNDPIADSVRGILDGHIVLDRAIAAQGRFPAVDPLASISRLATKLRSEEQAQLVAQLIHLISIYEDSKDLRTLGGYKSGSNPTLDRALLLVPRIYDAMKQTPSDPIFTDVFETLLATLSGA